MKIQNYKTEAAKEKLYICMYVKCIYVCMLNFVKCLI